ncbi:MAG: MFS transporter [Streptomyces sp.]|uniref:MFS transporter n=1 Tax=Streptomyces sp. TaxID=1931 RepID=UPI0025EC95B4|nr:MFS transporter [Streptomyces sp.]MBW8798770.1 MFS transporter [Streptomyces sp.]
MSAAEHPPSLLRNSGFVRLASARIISVLGNGFARIALAFAVLSLPGATPGDLSLVVACQAVPQLALVLVGGVIADRVSRSALMAVADLLGALSYGGLAAMVLSGHAPVAALCVLAVTAGTATALFSPAMDGIIPMLVPSEALQRANGLLRVGTNTSLLLGLALSGATVAWVGAGWALAINGLSFVVSAALTSSLRLSRRPQKSASGWADLREGWREFASRQWLWVVVVQFSLVVAATNANAGVLGPLAARAHFGGARAWSVVVAAQALGAVAGAGIAARARVTRPILAAVLFTLPSALPPALLGAGAPLWAVAAGAFTAGVSLDFFGVLWATTMQREIPEEALSRVSSYDWFGSLTLAPLGLALAGPAADTFGTDRMLIVCATLIVAATLAALLSPGVRSLRATPGADRPELLEATTAS